MLDLMLDKKIKNEPILLSSHDTAFLHYLMISRHKDPLVVGIVFKADSDPDGTSRKSGPWTFRKSGLMPKFIVLPKKSFLTKLRVLISNMAIVY